MKIKKSNTWIDKVIVLIEKECALYDKRSKKEKKKNPHIPGKCYVDDIIAQICIGIDLAEQKLIKKYKIKMED